MIKNLSLINSEFTFVAVAFLITIFACFLFYRRTLKTLKKYENDFASELKKMPKSKREIVLRKSKIVNKILVSTNKSI